MSFIVPMRLSNIGRSFVRLPKYRNIAQQQIRLTSQNTNLETGSNLGLLLSNSCVKRLQDICQDEPGQFLRVTVSFLKTFIIMI